MNNPYVLLLVYNLYSLQKIYLFSGTKPSILCMSLLYKHLFLFIVEYWLNKC